MGAGWYIEIKRWSILIFWRWIFSLNNAGWNYLVREKDGSCVSGVLYIWFAKYSKFKPKQFLKLKIKMTKIKILSSQTCNITEKREKIEFPIQLDA